LHQKKEKHQKRRNTKNLSYLKSKKAAKSHTKGDSKKRHATHTKVRFYRPKTLKLARNPKYVRRASAVHPRNVGLDKFSVILSPVTTEKAMKKMEEENTMVFICDPRANKI